jgi:hypothetical protein
MQIMKQTILKSRNETVNRPSIVGLDAEYVLNVAIVYQDKPTPYGQNSHAASRW